MDLETQQGQFDDNIKLNSILSSIEKQNTLLDEISKNNQAARPTNSIVLDKPVLGTDNKNKDLEKSVDVTKQDENSITTINIKEDVVKSDVADDEQAEQDDVISKDTDIPQDGPENNTKTQKSEDKPTDNMPDWFNIVKDQIGELIDSNGNKDIVEFGEPNGIEKNEKAAQETISAVTEPVVTGEENVQETISVNEINENTEEKSLEDIEPVVNTNNITERISEKSQDNFYKISDIKEDTDPIVESVQATEEQELAPEKEASIISVVSKKQISSADSSNAKASPEAEPAEMNEGAQEITSNNSEVTSEPTIAALPEQEQPQSVESNQQFSENTDTLKGENNQSLPTESMPGVAQS